MKTLEQIKDEVAKEHSSSSWEDMMFKYGGVGDTIIDKVVHRYARKVAQASLEKAAEKAKVQCEDSFDYFKVEDEFSMRGHSFKVHKESITNQQNIVML
ncbi:hypothetical protein CMU81_02400 [Elizabethkingia anophelis]|uniref:Uncharacterized protein n=1 Tax=Elizabethkingia anophelis TaxID=1117645 RepID=A0A494JAX7_9FLAO|nr:hypothetical protein [Elizabethkingia anophelis]AQX52441.1 hypothetical protein AYC66_17930 [Elizabethkingia anophelis]MDV3554539.1 hypothetical protein [Elizabethkingia anophelis]MDV3612676.1 hypothetical protein [Elizabethkingia anophelis]MDV3651760.1 hypothetical protein [Elizabethkingia anophelis]MDV3888474.1 hypothetical protein [Elizabethkingia anophelis]